MINNIIKTKNKKQEKINELLELERKKEERNAYQKKYYEVNKEK